MNINKNSSYYFRNHLAWQIEPVTETVYVQGEAYPCVKYRQFIGNIFFDNINNIWSNAKRKEIANLKHKDLNDCINCDNLNRYSPCHGVSHMESGSILNCVKAR